MSYTNVHVNISENQKRNLKQAIESKGPVSIRLGYEDLEGNDLLALTNSQVNRMKKAYENGKGITIKMSKRQVEHNKTTEGGFLSLLAGLAPKALPFLARTVLPTLATGALSGVGLHLLRRLLTKLWETVCIFKKARTSQESKQTVKGCI